MLFAFGSGDTWGRVPAGINPVRCISMRPVRLEESKKQLAVVMPISTLIQSFLLWVGPKSETMRASFCEPRRSALPTNSEFSCTVVIGFLCCMWRN